MRRERDGDREGKNESNNLVGYLTISKRLHNMTRAFYQSIIKSIGYAHRLT